jgi:aldehyde:ferredoxin oxidoreductase
LGPDNILVFTTGTLTGTGAPTGNSWYPVYKSPLGIYGEGRGGGFWGSELKFAGYDAIVIKGRAKNPVYLSIVDDFIEIKDARELWGKDFFTTTDMIIEKHGDNKIKVLGIGQAGENLVKIAVIMSDKYRSAGRGGSGAIMGSKNLKAIAVRGTKKVAIADETKFRDIVRHCNQNLRSAKSVLQFASYGTVGALSMINELGMLITRNGQSNSYELSGEIDGEKFHETIMSKGRACYACSIGCTRHTTVNGGKYSGVDSEGPEFETVASLGARCGISNRDAIAMANMKCNMYGMDTISTGGVISFAMECYENGLLSIDDLNGIDLQWGNHSGMVEVIDMIAKREGWIGNILAGGVKEASNVIGGEATKYALHTKGLELPGLDPRGAQDRGLVYAVNNKGADHMRPNMGGYTAAGAMCKELGLERKGDPEVPEFKAELVEKLRRFTTFTNLNGMCIFAIGRFLLNPDHLASLHEAATGIKFTSSDVLIAGARVWTLQRMLNNAFGICRKDDSLPQRFLQEPSGGNIVELKQMLDDYYKIEDWDEDGRPTRERLKNLQMEDLLK